MPTLNKLTRRSAVVAITAPVLLGGCQSLPPLNLPEGTQPIAFDLPGRALPLRCVVTVPRGYTNSSMPWPLVVFLHGSGERGADLEAVKMHGPPKLVAAGAAWPAVLVSPQLEAGADWMPADLHALAAMLVARMRIDARRVLATGLSLGGMGVWNWAAAYPQDLAAIAPVCGFGDPKEACRARSVPVRAYHGAADTVVPLAAQQASVDALRACGGTVDFIVYPGVGHNAWDPAYNDPDLLPWLLRQRRA
ncbi:prolyl oligopeptidase family serine peptidase [soil metagenome]